jgi:hypothetical protein
LIKLTCLIGLIIAPILGGHLSEASHEGATEETSIQSEKKSSCCSEKNKTVAYQDATIK